MDTCVIKDHAINFVKFFCDKRGIPVTDDLVATYVTFSIGQQIEKVGEKFDKTVEGYHKTSLAPIKESLWECICYQTLKKFVQVTDLANGGHKSGEDMKIYGLGISNKTCKEAKDGILKISSYRLTCVDKNDMQGFKDEIERRDESFAFYALLVRKEYVNSCDYSFYLIPKEYLNLTNREWVKTYGKHGKFTGWKGDSFSISFSMSSKLWFSVNKSEISRFLIKTHTVQLTKCLDYSDM